MSRADWAEWILSLGTSPERAASIAGDLTEEAGSHRAAWFWWSVARTAVRPVWRAIAADPWGMAMLGLRGWLLQLAGAFLVFLCILPFAIACDLSLAQMDLFRLWLSPFAMFLIGCWMARISPGRELPAALFFEVTRWVAWMLFTISRPSTGVDFRLDYGPIPVALFLAGVIVERRRYLSRHRAMRSV